MTTSPFPFPIVAFLPPIAFAILDRLWGSNLKVMNRSGHSLGAIGSILTALAVYPFSNIYASVACLVWAPYRSIPFFGSSGAPRSAAEDLAALLRHLIGSVLVCGVLVVRTQGLTPSMLLTVAYAILATALAYLNGETDGELNHLVEISRGAVYGVMISALFLA